MAETKFCPHKVGDILVCDRETNFHCVGEVVIVERLDRRFTSDIEPYWVALKGKPGHYGWDHFRKATPDEIQSALHPESQAGRRALSEGGE